MPEKNTKRLNWEKYTWIDFERICFEYAKEKYNSTIYKVKITQAQKDGGRDIVISDTQNNRTAWGECKHHKQLTQISHFFMIIIIDILVKRELSTNLMKEIWKSFLNIQFHTKLPLELR